MKVAIIFTIIISLTACKTLPTKEKWEVAELQTEETEKKLRLLKSTMLKKSPDPIIRFYQLQKNAAEESCKSDSECMKQYVDVGINLSDKLCTDWFKQHLRDESQVNQTQGMVNVIGNGALAIASLAKASTDAIGYFSILLGGTNNSFEVHKQYSSLVEGTLDILEEEVRNGRAIIAKSLIDQVSQLDSFDQAQRKIRDYHNTCSRLHLMGYIRKSIELTEYKPKLPKLYSQQEITEQSAKAYNAITNKDGVFTNTDLRLLYFSLFGGDELKQKISGDNPYILAILNAFNASGNQLEILAAINQTGEKLNLNVELQKLKNAIAGQKNTKILLKKEEKMMRKIEKQLSKGESEKSKMASVVRQGKMKLAKSEALLSKLNVKVKKTQVYTVKEVIKEIQKELKISNQMKQLFDPSNKNLVQVFIEIESAQAKPTNHWTKTELNNIKLSLVQLGEDNDDISVESIKSLLSGRSLIDQKYISLLSKRDELSSQKSDTVASLSYLDGKINNLESSIGAQQINLRNKHITIIDLTNQNSKYEDDFNNFYFQPIELVTLEVGIK